jgi:hypothetical protein
MYYAIIDEAGMYLSTGFNTTNKKDLKHSLLELLQPESEEYDIKLLRKMPADEIAVHRGWRIDESETRFPDPFYAE